MMQAAMLGGLVAVAQLVGLLVGRFESWHRFGCFWSQFDNGILISGAFGGNRFIWISCFLLVLVPHLCSEQLYFVNLIRRQPDFGLLQSSGFVSLAEHLLD